MRNITQSDIAIALSNYRQKQIAKAIEEVNQGIYNF